MMKSMVLAALLSTASALVVTKVNVKIPGVNQAGYDHKYLPLIKPKVTREAEAVNAKADVTAMHGE